MLETHCFKKNTSNVNKYLLSNGNKYKQMNVLLKTIIKYFKVYYIVF